MLPNEEQALGEFLQFPATGLIAHGKMFTVPRAIHIRVKKTWEAKT